MIKAQRLVFLMLAALLLALIVPPKWSFARIIGTNPTGSSADQWCAGGTIRGNTTVNATEACLDYLGDLIPTTASGAALGTSALPWSAIFTGNITATGTITLPAGSIDTAKIANGSINTAKLATDSVDSTKILAGAVQAKEIGTGAVNTAKLASDSVTAVKILAGTIDTTKLANDSVGSAQILAGSVNTAKIGAQAVDTGKLLTGGDIDTVKFLCSGPQLGSRFGWATFAQIQAGICP